MEIYKGIYVFHDFIKDDECTKFVEFIENKINNNSNDIVNFTNTSGAINDKYKDVELAEDFFDRVITHAPKNLKDKIIKPNDLIYWSKYKPGSKFGLHTDTGLYYNKNEGLKSRYTLLAYLNDNFDGGETVFYDNYFKETIRVKPKKGSCIIFDIKLFHQGLTVENGEKYWIGCEIVGDFNELKEIKIQSV
jgi:Rps23 Pro-64 3,4-dihydroxylase Tpa1-like proline 4-hydroxylase